MRVRVRVVAGLVFRIVVMEVERDERFSHQGAHPYAQIRREDMHEAKPCQRLEVVDMKLRIIEYIQFTYFTSYTCYTHHLWDRENQ